MAPNMTALTAQFSSYNDNSLMDRLPTELIHLTLQFSLLLDSRTSLWSEHLYRGDWLAYYRDLSLLCRVCKKWRNIIETDSAFWVFICTTFPPKLLAKILERAPRFNNIFVDYTDSISLFRSIGLLAVGSKIVHMSKVWTCLYVRYALPTQILQALSQPLPRLRKLRFESSGKFGTFQGLETSFQSISLSLEILEVHDSIFPWTLSTMGNLLEIDVEFHKSCPYFNQGFIDVLRASPRLTFLKLRFCRTDFQPHLQSSSISLPHLRLIDIRDSSPAVGLLEAITCAPSTKISISERTSLPTIQNPWVKAAFAHTSFECTDSVNLKLLPHSVIGAAVGNLNIELRQVAYPIPYQAKAVIQFLTDLLRPFSETNGAKVTTLELVLDLEWDAAPVARSLASFFPNITSLVLRCHFGANTSSSLFDALSQPVVEEGGERRWLFPRIEKLTVDGGKWYDDFLPESITNMIRSRLHIQKSSVAVADDFSLPRPHPLRELHFKECLMLRSEANELQRVLGDAVEFDGVQVQNSRFIHSLRSRFGTG